MNKNEKFVITINREIGSGGRTVGSKLAEKLGVPFYDKALIEALIKKYNLSVEEIEVDVDEFLDNSLVGFDACSLEAGIKVSFAYTLEQDVGKHG